MWCYLVGNKEYRFDTREKCLASVRKKLKLSGKQTYKEFTIFSMPKDIPVIHPQRKNEITSYAFHHGMRGVAWVSNSFYPQYQTFSNDRWSKNIKPDGTLGEIGWRHP